MRSRVRVLASLLGVLAPGLTACVPSLRDNPAREPRRDLPADFGGQSGPAANPPTSRAAGPEELRTLFVSPSLAALVDLALASNQELNLRVQETLIARYEIGARRGEVVPAVRARAGAGAEKVGRHTSQGFSDEDHGLPPVLGDLRLGLDLSWEVDLWRKLRDAVKAANLRWLATREAQQFLVTQLVAEIARSYYELVALDALLGLLERNIELQTDALQIVRAQKEAARVTELAVQRFEAEVAHNRSRRYLLAQERVVVENRINLLVGRYPQPVPRSAEDFARALPSVDDAGLPARLLENRPDVRQAALDLEAAKVDVQVARASFFPALSIDASAGYRAFNPRHLVATPGSLVVEAMGGLVAPLLNRAAITAEYRAANARQIQAVLRYEQVLLQAFTDVVNQLARLRNLRAAYELRARQVETLRGSVDVSLVLFQSARADYMEVLLTRRDALEAEMELNETRRGLFDAVIDLYRALGGGWFAAAGERADPS